MELCELAAKEPDGDKLIALTNEITRLLDEKKYPRYPLNSNDSRRDSRSA